MEIRKYMADDYHGIIDLTEDTYREQLDGFLKHPECLSICVSGGKAVGWSYLTLPEDALGACFIYIYVAPAFRRRGAGRAMYEEILERIPDRKLERWSSYMPLEAADRFALAMGFDYVNTNSYMEFAGEFTDARDGAIRPYTDEDYPAGPDIWTEEYARMHRMLGLPYSMPDRNDEWRAAERAEYARNAAYTFVFEEDGRIVGIGSLFDDNSGIGALAVDNRFAGKGYGKRLARFMTDECIRRGCEKPHLYCETNNRPAFCVYEKIGYREISRETVAIKK